jgi:hypothetical protein
VSARYFLISFSCFPTLSCNVLRSTHIKQCIDVFLTPLINPTLSWVPRPKVTDEGTKKKIKEFQDNYCQPLTDEVGSKDRLFLRGGLSLDSLQVACPPVLLKWQAAGNLGTMRPSRTYAGRGSESMLYVMLGRSGRAGTAAFGSNSWWKNRARVLAHMSSTAFTPTVRLEEPRKDSLVDVGNVVGNRRQPEQQGN